MNLKNYFITETKIQLDSIYIGNKYKLYENDILLQEGIYQDIIVLELPINLNSLYHINVDDTLNEILKYKLYDSKEFNDLYNTDKQLGCILNTNEILFRVFAPTKFKINLNVYKTGHNDDLIKSIEMNKSDGIFEVKLNIDYENYYYTYCVFDNIDKNSFIEVCDPYAKTTGVNGQRAMITDLKNTPTITSKYPKRKFNEAIVYELHVRDFSVDESWNGKKEYRGKFLGLIEEFTTYTKNEISIKTGFDHIKELGVTDIQLLPIFDFAMVDETRLEDKTYYDIKDGIYNWGYMALNFNTLEGSYSTNPYDGLSRVKEFKQVVQKYNDNNIGIIMDVVYNHTSHTENSNFNILVPCYYHRMNNEEFSNASECGNETASERYMVSKFIVDSIVFLAKEYHLSGFRFDLMQIHDINTMNKISNELSKIDESILIYGEPWLASKSTLDESLQSSKDNLHKIDNVGAFNDLTRDSIRGSVFDYTKGGYIQGLTNIENIEKIKYGIVGGAFHNQIDTTYLSNGFWHTSSMKCVNYVAAHDNHTLWDKLTLSTDTSIEQRKEMLKQANGIILLSSGLAFIHAADEFCRSKPTIDGGLEENSYNSSDYTNKIRWSNKIDNYDVFEFHKKLIEFRKQYILNLNGDIVFNSEENGIISYSIDNEFLILINSFSENYVSLKQDMKTLLKNNIFINEKINNSKYKLEKNSINIFKI